MKYHFPDIVILSESPLEGDYMELDIPVNSKTKRIDKQLAKSKKS